MKPLLGALALLGFGAQGDDVATISRGDFTLTGIVREGDFAIEGEGRIVMERASLTSTSGDVRASAKRLDATFVARESENASPLKTATLDGDVSARVRDSQGDTNDVYAHRAVIESENGVEGEIRAAGNVTFLTGVRKDGRDISARGPRLRATFGPYQGPKTDAAPTREMRSARLEGGVALQMTVVPRPDPTKPDAAPVPQFYDVTGDRADLAFRPGGTPLNVRVEGNVTLKGKGDGTLDVPLVKAVVIALNEKGEATKISIENGDEPVTTTFRKGKKNR